MVHLICAFVFGTYAKCKLSHDTTYLSRDSKLSSTRQKPIELHVYQEKQNDMVYIILRLYQYNNLEIIFIISLYKYAK